jgi:hypothetical protein
MTVKKFSERLKQVKKDSELIGVNDYGIFVIKIGILISEVESLERRLAEAEKLVEKWRKRACGSEDIYDIVHNPALRSCSDDLEAVLRGGG